MKYANRLQKAVDYIGTRLDTPISLDEISAHSCLSKYHFHRLFTAFTGLSLHQYIRWLRLKRAAHQLIAYKEQSILTIAINAGFDSHEAFSRAFKKTCGLSPAQYRSSHDGSYWSKPPYCIPNSGSRKMNVEIRTIDKTKLAVIEHRGNPNAMAQSINKLITWAKNQPIDLKPRPGDAFGFAYDDPNTTPPENFRFDLALRVPNNFNLNQEVVEKYLPQGRYAVALHEGSHSRIGDTVYRLYRDWLPQSNEQLGELPCIFCYLNFEHEVAETELQTECWLLLE